MAKYHRTSRIRRPGDGIRAGLTWTDAVRLAGALTLLLGLAGVATAGAAQASQPAKAASSTWEIESTPNPGTAEISYLHAVWCTSAKACMAVGGYSNTLSSPGYTLAERWNGKAWSIQATPTPTGTAGDNLYGVSCTSASACTAVGDAFGTKAAVDFPLAESWNGKNRRVETTPVPKGAVSGAFFAVSCTSASACTAVGDYAAKAVTQSLIERWNGKAWAVQASAKADKSSWLMGVSCASARACTAVGYQNTGTGDAQLLAEGWNGKTWTAQKAPLPKGAPGGAFHAVSCTAPGACTASGTSFGGTGPTLAERWNGKNWSIQPTPNPANYPTSPEQTTLSGVSCASAKACTAIGQYAPDDLPAYFLEAWNGQSWRLVTAPVPVHFVSGALLGMSCAPARCTAVGAWSGGVRTQETLAMAN